MTSEADRTIKLEEEIAHLTITNEELSSEIALQWKRIEELEKKLFKFENRFMALEESVDNPIEVTKPPHW